MGNRHEEIDKLNKCLTDHNLHLTPLNDDSTLPGDYKWIRIKLLLNDISIDLAVDDEYDDISQPKPHTTPPTSFV